MVDPKPANYVQSIANWSRRLAEWRAAKHVRAILGYWDSLPLEGAALKGRRRK